MRKAPTTRARKFFAPLIAALLLALSLVVVSGSATTTAQAAAANNCQGSSNASEGWVKIDNAVGSVTGAFGSLSYNGNGANKTTVFYTLNAGFTLEICIKAGSSDYNSPVITGPVANGSFSATDNNGISHISYRVRVIIPADPSSTDPCGPNNATWTVPADTAGIDWNLSAGGVLTATAKDPYFFTDGTKTKNYGTATDSNAPCVTTINIPAEPGVTDPCGAGNATWNVPADGNGLDWSINQAGELVVDITAANTVFADSNNGPTSHNFGTPDETNTAPCVTEIAIPAEPSVTDPCGRGNATWNVPADGNGLAWTVNQAGELVVTITAANTVFENTNGATSHNFGTPDETNTQACVITVEIPAQPSVSDPCGAGNATWNVPADGNGLDWTLSQAGELIVTITAADTQFSNSNNGPTSHNFGTATETNTAACPPNQPNPQTVTETIEGCSLAQIGFPDSSGTAVRTGVQEYILVGGQYVLEPLSDVSWGPWTVTEYTDDEYFTECAEAQPDPITREVAGVQTDCDLEGTIYTIQTFTTPYVWNPETQTWELGEETGPEITEEFIPFTGELPEECVEEPEVRGEEAQVINHQLPDVEVKGEQAGVPTAVDAGIGTEESPLGSRRNPLWLLAVGGGLGLMGSAGLRRRATANR